MMLFLRNCIYGSITAISIILFIFSTSYAADVTLAWDRPDDSRVEGYHVYVASSGTGFTSEPSQTVGSADQTSSLIPDLKEGSTYDFAATSFDANGNESAFSETVTHTVQSSGTSDSETHTLVFGDATDTDKPGTVTDTFININEEINTASEQLNTYTWPDNMAANAALMRFDLSALPEGAQIQSAILKLYQINAGGDASYSVFIHRLINQNPDFQAANGYRYDGVNEWTPNDKCYESIPLAQADIAAAEDVNTLDHTTGYKQWDITSMVQQWAGEPASNYGLLLNSDFEATANSYRYFASSQAADPSIRPGLEVTYTVDSSETTSDGTEETSGDGSTDTTGEEDGGTVDETTGTEDTDSSGDSTTQDGEEVDDEYVYEAGIEFEMEFAETEISHEWKSIALNGIYNDPVVVAKPMSLNDRDPAVIRIKNVSWKGFDVRIQEWDYLDGAHGTEKSGFIAMEAGSHELPNGILVEAGTFETNSATTVNFSRPFNNKPVVICAITSENELDAVAGRTYNVTPDGFVFELQEQQANKKGHYAAEKISFIAWEPSSGTTDGISYIVDATFDEVTHDPHALKFYPAFETDPVFIADMQTKNAKDPSNVRWKNKNMQGAELLIHEEQSQNPEMNHSGEVVGYMGFCKSP